MRPTLALALLSALTGCVAAPRGPHAEYRTGMTPVAPPVTASGSYVLHSAGTVVAVRNVDKGQPLGFSRGQNGSIEAVSHDFSLPLNGSGYTWVFANTAEPSRTDDFFAHAVGTYGKAILLGYGVGALVVLGLVLDKR